MAKIPDEEIINLLQNGSQPEVNKVLTYLHRQIYGQVKSFIFRHHGTSNDTEDIFQDGLLVIYKLARKGGLKEAINVEAYLFTICKNLWLQQLRKKKNIIAIEEMNTEITTPDVPLFRLLEKEQQEALKKLIGQIGDGCRKVLIFYYYKKVRMKEIAERMSYSSEQVAKNKKSDCLKKLKKIMLLSPVFKNQIR